MAVLALAGPPFVTDDPEPTELGHFEMYLFSEGVHTQGDQEATLPGFELNYGAAKDLELSFSANEDHRDPRGEPSAWHYGSTELAVDWRFIHEDEQGWLPQVSIYPSIDIPSNGHDSEKYLPILLGKGFGKWEIFGGGGPQWNPGADGKDSWFAGVGVLRQVTDHLQLGGEVFRQTAQAKDDKNETSFNLGSIYDFNETWHIVGSAGRGLKNITATNTFSYYIGLELTVP